MSEELRIGVFLCHCGSNIAGVLDIDKMQAEIEKLDDVVFVGQNMFSCADPGVAQIKQSIVEHKLNRVVVAACTPRTHEPIFREACEQAGINKYLFEMANIRDHCSWVHYKEPEAAQIKATDTVKMAVARVRYHRPQTELELPVDNKALVIGGGIAGMQAAYDLAQSGHKVYLVEKEPTIGGMMAKLDKIYPAVECCI